VTGPLGCVLPTFIYDIASDSWTIGADIPNRGSDQCGGYVNEKFYVMGGWAPDYSGVQNFNQIYDPVTNEWTAGPALPTGRGDLMCTIFQGEFYAIGGYVINATNSSDQNSFSATVESFNPNTTVWTTRPPMLTPRGDGAVTVLPGDKMMVVGGEGHYDNNMNWKYPKHVNEIYYGTDYTWVEKAMIPTARFRTAAATAGGLAFVFGGADVCIVDGLPNDPCPALNASEVYLDVDHPHLYIYLKNEAYNDNAALTTYPV
jgi:N-acetylneuraminic acid mutarotase